MNAFLTSLSPMVQRVVAIGLVLLSVLLIIEWCVLPLTQMTATALDNLNDARFEKARVDALAAQPEPEPMPVLDASLLIAPLEGTDSFQQLSNIITASAQSAGVNTINVQPSITEETRTLNANVILEGPVNGIQQTLSTLEQSTPIIRFSSWQFEALTEQPGTIRFSGQAIAAGATEQSQ